MSTSSQTPTANSVGAVTPSTAVNSGSNPYVFVVGSPRSGTTLLKRLLDAHPLLAMTRETHWIPRFFERGIGLTADGRVTPALIKKLHEHRRFSHLRLDPREVEEAATAFEGRPYSDFVSNLFELYARGDGKPFVGDKTPPYVRKIDVLSKLWPRVRFVHLVRDGRDVCLSMRKWRMAHRAAGRRKTWQEDPVSTTALWWEWLVRLGREAGARLPGSRYLELRYEDLIANPEQQCRQVCRFLDLPYAVEMLDYHKGKTRTGSDLSANGAWLPPTPGLRDWRSQMPADDLRRFEAVAGRLLGELGYERSLNESGSDTARHADRMRREFDGRPLPRNWGGDTLAKTLKP